MLVTLLLACSSGPEEQAPATDHTHDAHSVDSASTTDSHSVHTGRTTSHSTTPAPTADTATPDVPRYQGPLHLSETELYADLGTDELAEGVVALEPTWPLWTDGAQKRRWLWVPPGETIDTSDPDHWVFPVGTVAFKEFVRDGVRVETRRLAKLDDGAWDYASYLWRADGSDADVLEEPLEDALGTPHDIPSRVDCSTCHVGPADLFLGIAALQLPLEQQARLPLTAPVHATVPGEGDTQQALGYLFGNCGHCHRDGTLHADRNDLRMSLSVADSDPTQVPAIVSAVGQPAKHWVAGTTLLVVPGDPDSSQLYKRMELTGLNRMPPAGTEDADPAALDVVGNWIRSIVP